MKKVLFLLFFAISATFVHAQDDLSKQIKIKEDSVKLYESKIKQLQNAIEDLQLANLRNNLKTNGLPKLEIGEELIEHSAMMLVYSEKHEQAKWVAHIISPNVLKGKEGRSNDFRVDAKIKTGSSQEEDYFSKTPDSKAKGRYAYKGFGFDRGHLAPSADFSWSQKALSESFFYSNMSPQRPEFNRDSWAKLEDMMRAYISRNPTTQLYIITGGILKDDLPKVTQAVNKNLSIPEKYYKIAVDLQNKRAVAFLMPNKKAEYPHESYATSINEIEKLTGIDFFANLEDGLEATLQAQKDPKPFLSSAEQTDVEPVHPPSLPPNTFNTVQAKLYINEKKIRVCGTVVSTKLSAKGNIFLNLDKQFPNQIFSISIFKDKMANFSYKPEQFLMGKKIYVTGKVTDFNGTPTINVENESAIEVLEE